jgi:hypothetical protein
MNFGTLGFVDNSRGRVTRDATFTGGTGHVSHTKDWSKNVVRPTDRVTQSHSGVSRLKNLLPENVGVVGAVATPETGRGPIPRPNQSDMSTLSLLDRKCLFLEAQDKRRGTELAEVRGNTTVLEENFETRLTECESRLTEKMNHCEAICARTNSFLTSESSIGIIFVTATTLMETPTFLADEEGVGGLGGASSLLETNTNIKLAFPMHKIGNNVYMRQLQVDPFNASLTWRFVQIFSNENGIRRAFVGEFRET